MTVITVPGFKIDTLVMESPNGIVILGSGILIWDTQSFDAQPQGQIHFHVEIATDSGFATIIEHGRSWLGVSQFDYESSPGVWTALPTTGLAQANLGKRVRYRSATTTFTTYFWRVRVEEFV